MHVIPIEKSFSKIRSFIRNKDPLTFFLGAGISIKNPSFAPVWPELRDSLLQALIDRLPELSIASIDTRKLFYDIQQHAAKQDLWIKPEIVLEWLYSRLSNKLLESLKVLDAGTPNVNHNLLAGLLAENNNILLATTNFDLYIEKAFQNWHQGKKHLITYASSGKDVGEICPFSEYAELSEKGKALLKLHGTLRYPSTIRATLRQVSMPVTDELENCFKKLIFDRHMVVMGYSGNDYDIFNLFEKYAKKARSLIWFAFQEDAYRNEVNHFPNTEIYMGDIAKFSESFWKEISKPPGFREFLFKEEKVKSPDIQKFLKTWASTLNLFEVAYSLSLFTMHIGAFAISNKLCNLLESHTGIPKEYVLRALNVRGVNNKRNDPELAWGIYHRALGMIEGADIEFPLIYGNILGNIGALAHELGKDQDALQYLKMSNKYARKAGALPLRYSNHDDIGNVLRSLGQPQRALRHHRLAEKYRKRNGDLIGLSLTLNNLGLAFAELKDYKTARYYLEKSIELKKNETCDTPALARGLMNLGEVNILLINFLRAIRLLNKGKKICENLGDNTGKTRCLYDIAYCLTLANHQKMAKKIYDEAERNASAIENWTDNKSWMDWIGKIKAEFIPK